MRDGVLVICGIGLGNMICVTPLIRELAKKYTVHVLAFRLNSPGTVDLFRLCPEVQSVFTNADDIKQSYVAVINTFATANRSFSALAERLKAKKYVQTACNKNQNAISEAEWNMNALRHIGLPYPDKFPATWAPMSTRSFPEFNVGFHVGCVIGSFWERKKWGGFQYLARLLTGKKIVMVGSKREAPLAGWPSNITDLTGLSIADTARVCANCRVFVSNDSGVMHLAGAVGTRTVAIFGGTSEKKAVSPGAPIHVVTAPGVTCRPCRQHEPTWRACEDWKCMNGITPGMVKVEVDRLS